MTRLVLLVLVFHSVLTHGPAAASAASDPALELRQLFEAEWEHEMEQNPTWASQLGDRRWNDRWEDLSLENIARQHEHRKGVLARLAKIPRGRLGTKDRLNYDLFAKQYQTAVDEFPFQWYLLPLNHREGIQTTDDLADALRFESLKDYEDWIARLRAFPTYSQQTIALLRRGLEAGMQLPRIVMQRLPAQIDKQLVEGATNSPFYRPFRSFPAAIVEADRARLSEQARTAITRGVLPAFRDLKRFVTETYLPACPEEVGIWKLPRGEELYRFFARKFTTTDYEPRRIHELGLAEVKRIREQMENIKRQTGFSGELADFFQWLRTDPQFYFRSGDELLAAYRAMGKRIDPLMVKIFHTLPRMPYGIEPIPDNIAPDTTTAYYRQPAADGSRAGTYFVNLYKPETRPKYEMMALSLHEAIPGHHHQIALAMELGEMPNFRRYGGYTAFIEGWGLYAESLGEDLKLYDDPYSKFGQLTYEMWRAVRLVVDTGMHTLKWPRQRAIDYFLANAAKTELDVVNEIDRYIAWPGQALAYKIGELKLQELRKLARQELGDKFDLKKFHDAVLLAGAVPLDILEQNIKDWMRKP